MEKRTLREVARNLQYKSDPNADKGGGGKKIRKFGDIISGSPRTGFAGPILSPCYAVCRFCLAVCHHALLVRDVVWL